MAERTEKTPYGCSLFGRRQICCEPIVFKQLFVLMGAFS